MKLEASREKTFEPRRSLVSGIVTDGSLPTVLATTQDAERCAVTNRVLAPKANPTQEALEKYKLAFAREEFQAVSTHIDTSITAFRRWLAKLKTTYPQTYIDAMEEAWKNNQGVEAPPVPTKPFEKIEKSGLTLGVDGGKSTKARLIQPPEDIDKAVMGPLVWQLWENVRRAWNGSETPVLYASGYTSAYIGSLVDSFIEEHVDVVAWSVDEGCYDSTLVLSYNKRHLIGITLLVCQNGCRRGLLVSDHAGGHLME